MATPTPVPARLRVWLTLAAAALALPAAALLEIEPAAAKTTFTRPTLQDQDQDQDGETPKPKPASPRAKTKTKSNAKSKTETPAPADEPAPAPDTPAPAPAPADEGIRFSRDVAPVLVANCQGCHNPRSANYRRHQFDMTTFQSLMRGGVSGPQIVARDIAGSDLVGHVKGADGLSRMPPGGQNNLADETIAKIEEWINAGALLDAGRSPTAAIASYAASAEQLERDALARLAPDQRLKLALDGARELFKKGNSPDNPNTAQSAHFVMIGALPEDRMKRALDEAERRLPVMLNIFAKRNAPPIVDPKGHVAVVVFNTPNEFAEFVQSQENRQIRVDEEQGVARIEGRVPYVALLDPLGGNPESLDDARKKRAPARGKKAAELENPLGTPGAGRSLPGLLVEHLASGIAARAGLKNQSLILGFGAYFASLVEPDSPHVLALRATAARQYRVGWEVKANELIADQGEPLEIRAIGFTFVEWLMNNPQTRNRVPLYLQTLAEKPRGEFDEVTKQVYGVNDRNQMVALWGQYVWSRYGRLAR